MVTRDPNPELCDFRAELILVQCVSEGLSCPVDGVCENEQTQCDKNHQVRMDKAAAPAEEH